MKTREALPMIVSSDIMCRPCLKIAAHSWYRVYGGAKHLVRGVREYILVKGTKTILRTIVS